MGRGISEPAAGQAETAEHSSSLFQSSSRNREKGFKDFLTLFKEAHQLPAALQDSAAMRLGSLACAAPRQQCINGHGPASPALAPPMSRQCLQPPRSSTAERSADLGGLPMVGGSGQEVLLSRGLGYPTHASGVCTGSPRQWSSWHSSSPTHPRVSLHPCPKDFYKSHEETEFQRS